MNATTLFAVLAVCAVPVLAWVVVASRRRKAHSPSAERSTVTAPLATASDRTAPATTPPTQPGQSVDSFLSKGEHLFARGAFADALTVYQQALKLAEQPGAIHPKKGLALKNAGEALQRLGRLDEASAHFAEAQSCFRAQNNLVGEAYVIKSLGNLHLQEGAPDQAMQRYTEATDLFRSAGHNQGLGFAFKGQGDALHKMGNLAEARQMYQQAIDLFQQTNQMEGVAETLLSLGDVLVDEADRAGAMAKYEEANRLYQTHNIVSFANRASASIADLASRSPELERAIAHTVRLFREHPQTDDWDIALQMIAEGMSPAKAWQLVMFVPTAYGRTILDQMGAKLPKTYTVHNMDTNERQEQSLVENLVYMAAYRLALQERQQGVSREAWNHVFGRSAEAKAMNQALSKQEKPENLVFSPPALSGFGEHLAPVSWD